MKCVIICGGDFSPPLLPKRNKDDLWIAADSGLRWLEGTGIVPDIAIGDWDSLGAVPTDIAAVTLPVRKDDTDLGAALRLGMERGCRSFCILGAMGGARPSHSFAAVQLLHWLKTRGCDGEILDARCRICVLAAGETKDFDAGQRGHLSCFALTTTARVNLSGLWYSGEGFMLESSFPLGVSNAFVGTAARVACTDGTVLVIAEEA